MALRYKSLVALVVVLFAQMLLMAWQLRRDQDVPLVRNSVVYVVAPIQRGLNAVARSIRGVWDGYIGLRGAHRQNEALSGELGELKMENQRLLEQAEQGRRLQVLFNLREQIPLPTLAAQVLSAGSSDTARLVMIDKGADHGLRPDLPVLVADGVVGKVLHVFPDTAQVLLLTDSYSGVACLLEGSRAHGILKGQNGPLGSLGYVPNGEEVKAGQRVVTSGEDRIFPKGLPVGVVVDAKPGPEFQQITVQPLAPLNRLEEVLVIMQSGGEVANFPVASNGASQQEKTSQASEVSAVPPSPAAAGAAPPATSAPRPAAGAPSPARTVPAAPRAAPPAPSTISPAPALPETTAVPPTVPPQDPAEVLPQGAAEDTTEDTQPSQQPAQ